MHHPLVEKILHLRGLEDEKEQEHFLHPDWERDTHDPFLLKDMHRACERIARAIQNNETILLWSDYDMDGIPGAVVLYDFFQLIGYECVRHYTPHRNKDGFGLNEAGLREAREAGVSLVITIDCGIADVACAEYARKEELDLIITDHHIPPEVLPSAYAIINPKQKDCAYPEKMLCGAGVAFKLVQGMRDFFVEHKILSQEKLPTKDALKWLLDMVGMATIADMVPLVGENRVFAHFGLVVLRKSRRCGLQALLKKAKVDQRFLTEEDIGFSIAPRINAASRMGHASDAFFLLASKDPQEAGGYAEKLEKINSERKTLVATMKRDIHARLKKRDTLAPVVVLGDPDWKPSLLGLVASGLAEEFVRPVFLWGREEGTVIKGSCRSGGGVQVHTLMHEAREQFLEYGGHAYSGGFSVSHEKVHTLEEGLVSALAALPEAEEEKEACLPLALSEVHRETMRALSLCAPFGVGNPRPLFCFEGVRVETMRSFGKASEHLEVVFSHDGAGAKAIAFFTTPEKHPALVVGNTVSLHAYLEHSRFGGKEEVRLRMVRVGK
jgi:single-stranded-DNA-specific exonuclease